MAKAKTIEETIKFVNNPDNLMSFGKSFATLNGQPLDKSSIFKSKSEADAFAASASAYVGKIIVVVENGNVTAYLIDQDSTLKPVGDKASLDALKKAYEADIKRLDEKDAAQDIAIADKETRVAAIESAYLKSVSFDSPSGTFSFVKQDGTTQTVDLKLESVIKSFTYDSATEELVLKDEDGNETRVKVSALIDIYTGVDGTEVKVDVSQDNAISASLKSNSIASSKLTTTVNADIAKGVDAQTRVATAETDISNLNKNLTTLTNKVNHVDTGLDTKASQKDLTALQNKVDDSVTGLATRASQSDLNTLIDRVDAHDPLLAGLRTDVDIKQTAAQVNQLIADANISTDKLVNGKEIFILNGGSAK